MVKRQLHKSPVMKIKKNLKIAIPKDVTVMYCPSRNLLIIKGVAKTLSIKPAFRIVLTQNAISPAVITVTDIPSQRLPKDELKMRQKFRGKFASKLRGCVVETQIAFYRKLKLVGVGYRMLLADGEQTARSFTIKLGYSHLIYGVLPQGLSVFCRRRVYPTIFGSVSNDLISQTVAKIRGLRAPEPYKGKGVLHLEEKVTLKQGKKI